MAILSLLVCMFACSTTVALWCPFIARSKAQVVRGIYNSIRSNNETAFIFGGGPCLGLSLSFALISVKRIGVGLFIATALGGATLGSVCADKFGFGSGSKKYVGKVIWACLCCTSVGVVLAGGDLLVGRLKCRGIQISDAIVFSLCSLTAGFLYTLQHSSNAQLAHFSGHPTALAVSAFFATLVFAAVLSRIDPTLLGYRMPRSTLEAGGTLCLATLFSAGSWYTATTAAGLGSLRLYALSTLALAISGLALEACRLTSLPPRSWQRTHAVGLILIAGGCLVTESVSRIRCIRRQPEECVCETCMFVHVHEDEDEGSEEVGHASEDTCRFQQQSLAMEA